MKRLAFAFLAIFIGFFAHSQSVPFPPGPFDPNKLEPWGYQNTNLGWNTATYLPFRYQNRHFRLMPPNGVTYNSSTKTWSFSEPGKKYPLILFFHGLGETGLDNNQQLIHGGEKHKNAVLNGTFPGFLLYPQSATIEQAKAILEKIIQDLPVDINRIYVHGLSNGGVDTWRFTIKYPTLVAASFPMSAASNAAKTDTLLYTPIRQAQGGLDKNPGPWWSEQIVEWFNENGGHLEYIYLPDVGHSTWNTMYNRSDFFSWFLAQKKNKIMVRYNRNEQCPEEPTNVTMGFTPGFDSYEWRKDGVFYDSGHAVHKITVTQHGTYTGRIKNRGVWSEWSEPVVVKYRSQTVTPPIKLESLQSVVIPDINDNSTINFTLPEGYETYAYYKNGSSVPFATTRTTTVNTPGVYTAIVKEFGGCSSIVSVPFVVIDANGPERPDAIQNLQAGAVSKTEIRLNWENNTNPIVNETGFEIYRSLNGAGPYSLVAVVGADILTYSDKNLPSNTVYFYRVRPISNNGAGPVSAVVSATTETDVTPPSAPASLTVTSQSRTSIGLSWPASTDDVGVVGYDVYIRQQGQSTYVKAYTTTSTTQLVAQLTPGTLYNFIVKARDAEGNVSAASPTAIAATILKGLNYAYYEGSWDVLPNFNTLTPVATGMVNNFSLTPRLKNDDFAFVFTGYLQIPTSGQYTFYTSSDDGSKLWVNNMTTPIVNNDGLHGNQEKSGTVYLNAGYYPIRAEFFEKGGDEIFQVRWQGPSISKNLIPDDRLTEGFTLPAAPSAPSGLSLTVVDFRSIRLNWNTYNGTGTEIEIYRSLNGSSWSIINTVPSSVKTYTDSNLASSTRYYYRLRAVNSGNVSGYTGSVNATTQALPPLPAVPSNLKITNTTVNTVTINWQDNSNNEDSFEIYKSTGNNTSYSKIATVPANTTTFTDNSLFAHTKYYYKVVSKNVRGLSAFSNEVQTTTLNSNPMLVGARNIVMRYDEVVQLPLSASDADNDLVIIGGTNLPSFTLLYDDGNGRGFLALTPSEADKGVYSNLELYAMDIFGGIHTVNFSITINDNHSPVISVVSSATVKETNTLVISATATDADGDNLTWSIENAPAFMSSQQQGNSLNLTFSPGVDDGGVYTVAITASDTNGSMDTKLVTVTVENYDPNFFVNINLRTYTTANGPAGWNNVGSDTNSARGTYELNKTDGTSSGLSVTLDGDWYIKKDNSGVAPGIYPDVVNKSFLFFYGNTPRIMRFTGLNPQGRYNFSFLSSNKIEQTNQEWLTKITIGGEMKSIAPLNNASELIVFTALSPNAEGVIEVLFTGASKGYGCINAIVLESYYEGTSVPTAPSNLEATVVSEKIQVTWSDNSSSEQTVELFKSSDNVSFTKIATLLKDAISYTDNDFVAGVTYYYKVTAVNGNGSSPYSNTASVVAPNRTPVLAPVPAIHMRELDMKWIEVSASDGDNDQLSFTLEGELPFMWTEYVANGKMNLVFAPSMGDHGSYRMILHCDDTRGARVSTPIDVNITNITDVEFRINFTGPSVLAPQPWNNVTSYSANTVVNNLKNSNGTTTSVSLTLVNAWTALNANGYTTGNNTGMYPDAAMVNSFYVDNNTTRNILLSGLNPDKAYDFTFFASRMGVSDVRKTNYTIGTKTVSLDATKNSSNVAKIIGIRPAANGQISISVAKEASSPIGYLNTLVIREYVLPPTAPDAPIGLTSQVMTRNSIQLKWQDVSVNETGFEIFRSVGNNTNFQLIGTVGANVTSFVSNGLSMNTTYYYKVRAINNVGPSDYSNETSGTTYEYSVSVNFFAVNGGPSSWNNLPFYTTGQSVSNLIDDLGNNTGISMTVVKEFAGTNPFGVKTGNDSGVVPDKVLEGSWWVDPRGVAILRFENMSFLRRYNFSFVGSRDGTGDRNTVYIINGNSVTLNSSMNTSNMVQLKDISPDPDGTITVTITTTSTAVFGYLNGLIIQAVPLGGGGGGGARLATEVAGENLKVNAEQQLSLKAFPNPFVDQATLQVKGISASATLKARLISAEGRVVFEEELNYSGQENVDLDFGQDIPGGVYILRVSDGTGILSNIRLIKK